MVKTCVWLGQFHPHQADLSSLSFNQLLDGLSAQVCQPLHSRRCTFIMSQLSEVLSMVTHTQRQWFSVCQKWYIGSKTVLSSPEPEPVMYPSVPGACGATVDTYLEFIKKWMCRTLDPDESKMRPIQSIHQQPCRSTFGQEWWTDRSFCKPNFCRVSVLPAEVTWERVCLSCCPSFHQDIWCQFYSVRTGALSGELPVFVPSILCSHFWVCASVVPCLAQYYHPPHPRQKALCKMRHHAIILDLQYVVWLGKALSAIDYSMLCFTIDARWECEKEGEDTLMATYTGCTVKFVLCIWPKINYEGSHVSSEMYSMS